MSGSAVHELHPAPSSAEIRRIRLRFLLAAVACIPLGLAAKRIDSGPFAWVSNEAAGAIYVLWWSLLTFALLPRTSRRKIVLTVLAMTGTIEVLQLFDAPILESIRATRPGRLVLGSTFSFRDFPPYIVGPLISLLLGRALGGGATTRASDASSDGGGPS